MNARATESAFWPNLTFECTHCHRVAKSIAMQPQADITAADYPFQKICSDFFTWGNHEYVVIVDSYSNWPMAFMSENGAEGLIKRLRKCFVTFGVPEELTSQGGLQYTAGKNPSFPQVMGRSSQTLTAANCTLTAGPK